MGRFPPVGIQIINNGGGNTPIPPTPTPQTGTPASNGSPIVSTPGSNALVASVNFSNMNVQYFKINLEATKTNIYGEATEKWYYPQVLVRCIVARGTIANSEDEFGVGTAQSITVTIPDAIIQEYNFKPEVGDIMMDRELFYEVNSIDSQFVTAPGSLTQGAQGTTGYILTYVLTGYLTRITKLNLIEYYQ
jgi:hypothetical protein